MNNLNTLKRIVIFSFVIVCGIIYMFLSAKNSVNRESINNNVLTESNEIDFSRDIVETTTQIETIKSESLIKDVSYRKVVNINTANEEELITLPAVGPVTAKAIIEYREKYGNFKEKEEIKNVSGIGNNLFRKIEYYISVE